MRDKEELIERLIAIVHAAPRGTDVLDLPDWDADAWRRLLVEAEVRELGDGDLLMQRAETSSDLYFLVEGRVEVSVPQTDGLTLTAPIARGPGSVVGEIAFLDEGGRTASVWSCGASVALRLPKPAFDAFRAAEPRLACDIACAVGRIIAERLRRCIGAS